MASGVFADPEFVEKYGVCTINSPNWARILMQLVHYFYAYLRVCPECDRTSSHPLHCDRSPASRAPVC